MGFDMMIGPDRGVVIPDPTTSQPFPWEGKTAMHDQSIPARKKHQVEIGVKFGRWTVVGRSDRINSHRRKCYFFCVCECGKQVELERSSLTSGKSKSCGCSLEGRPLHYGGSRNQSRTRAYYNTWINMIRRCGVPTAAGYDLYGGRGIKVCPRWRDSIDAFVEDMGPRPDGTSLDRIDSDGDYEPNNCRWATALQQGRNRRNNRIIEHDGISRTVSEWAVITGIKFNTITNRLSRGWSVARALTVPPIQCNLNNKDDKQC